MLPILDYADIVWGDKDSVTLMKDLQLLRNKAAKLILGKPASSSPTEALKTLKWLNLVDLRKYHRCIYICKCITGQIDHSLLLSSQLDMHSHDTRNRDYIRLPREKENWGKQRLAFNN